MGGVARVEPAALAAAALAPQINIILRKQISREEAFEYNKISFIYNLLLFRQPQYTWIRVSELETHSPVRNKFSNSSTEFMHSSKSQSEFGLGRSPV